MLHRLYIKNYAIIEELDIVFSGNLNVITGETGAGKSILLGALSLILGERADLSMRPDNQHKTIIEGTFPLEDRPEVLAFFHANELDPERETILRREINASGKSRAFINDTPVNLQTLGALSALLVDLHQQFDSLQLYRADFQRQVLDALAGNKLLREEYQEKFGAYSRKQARLSELEARHGQLTRELDYDQFLFDELDAAAFDTDELETLEQEQQRITHAEALTQGLASAIAMIQEEDASVMNQLHQLRGKLEGIAAFDADLPALLARLQSASLELEDIGAELERINARTSFDEERIAFVQQRLDTGYKLLKKHGVRRTAELLAIREQLEEKLHAARHADEDLASINKEIQKLHDESLALAEKLSATRKAQLAPLMKKTNALLAAVGMPSAALKVEIKKGSLHSTGQDEVLFLFDANKSGNFQPLGKVASGGELSRLMLCIKSLVARSVSLPTLIFDEIDSGISGEAAKQVGRIMQQLAENHQVICITHQPQIAGKAHTHFQVFKQEKSGHISTHIRQLSAEERVLAIARMLSGEKPGKAALANARELMQQ
jgi:DNA repair protein RecN (Recombination protein N)